MVMTTFSHSCEGTDETTITTTAPADGSTNWSTITPKGTTGFYVYDTAQAITGSSSIRIGSTAAADRAIMQWTISPTVDTLSVRFYAYLQEPVGNTGVFFAAQTTGSARVAAISITTEGTTPGGGYLNVTDAAGSTQGSTSELTYNHWYRFEIVINRTTPSCVVNVFDGHGTTAIMTVTKSAFDPGTTSIDRVVFGKYSTNSTHTLWMDSIKAVTASTTPIGPEASGAAHYTLTANYTNDTTNIATWSVDTTASTGTTTFVQASTGGGTTATITGPSAGVYTITNPANADDLKFILTATSGGGASTQTIIISRGGGGGVLGTNKPYRWTLQGLPATDMPNWK
jgi:hypothetical protein